MVAEPWDLWSNEAGNFPTGWGEWNGHYRDTIRRFIAGGADAREVADVMNGDRSRFHGQAHPTVNMIDSHDGFTFMDLVSYHEKQNTRLRWPFGPSDGGSDDNLSSDHEGNHGLRRQHLRNLWTILFFSRGVPMVVAGDELGRTQNGNNNPWNVDSVAMANNYAMAATSSPCRTATDDGGAYDDNFGTGAGPVDRNPLFVFARYVVQARRTSATLHAEVHGRGVTYRFTREDGVRPLEGWNRAIAVRISGRAVNGCDYLVFLNMAEKTIGFTVGKPASGHRWSRIIDTADWAEPQGNCWDAHEGTRITGAYEVHPFSIVVLEETTSAD
jgi:isoamylase